MNHIVNPSKRLLHSQSPQLILRHQVGFGDLSIIMACLPMALSIETRNVSLQQPFRDVNCDIVSPMSDVCFRSQGEAMCRIGCPFTLPRVVVPHFGAGVQFLSVEYVNVRPLYCFGLRDCMLLLESVNTVMYFQKDNVTSVEVSWYDPFQVGELPTRIHVLTVCFRPSRAGGNGQTAKNVSALSLCDSNDACYVCSFKVKQLSVPPTTVTPPPTENGCSHWCYICKCHHSL